MVQCGGINLAILEEGEPDMAKMRQPTRYRSVTAIIGGVLLLVGFLCLLWMFFSQYSEKPFTSSLGLPGFSSSPSSEQQIAALQAQGITLSSTAQTPEVNQQQALALAGQLEADAASKAKNTSARYALLTYPVTKTPATHPDWNGVAVWIVWYHQIPQDPGNTFTDPKSSSRSYHDLYVCLDANSGKELFSLWS